MAKLIAKYEGLFQWWAYTVGHSQLLLRRTRSPDRPTQVDVLFKDVSSVQLTTTIEDPEIEERDAAPEGSAAGRKIFVVRGRGFEGQVVAATVLFDEGDRAHWEQSPLLPEFPPKA